MCETRTMFTIARNSRTIACIAQNNLGAEARRNGAVWIQWNDYLWRSTRRLMRKWSLANCMKGDNFIEAWKWWYLIDAISCYCAPFVLLATLYRLLWAAARTLSCIVSWLDNGIRSEQNRVDIVIRIVYCIYAGSDQYQWYRGYRRS